jgi:hypothetical protein
VNRLRLLALPLAAGAGCAAVGCHSADSGTIQLITDEEAGTFSESPVPTELQVVAVESADASTILATAQLPTSTIDLGQLSETAPVVSLNITGYDSAHDRRVFGACLPVQYDALAGQTIPIFVQRTGEFARLPGPLTDSRQAPVLAVLQGEDLLVAGGSDPSLATTTQLFDFGSFTAFPAPPAPPGGPESIAFTYGTVAWVINGTSASYYYDFSGSYATSTLTAPSGGSFADVAGGATIFDENGAQYIVGGTRTTAKSAMVLKVDPNDFSNTSYPFGNAKWFTLKTSRLGAAATWVVGKGLVVAGGNTSATDPGVEIVDETFDASTPFPSPADESSGLGAATLDGSHVLIAGGVSPSMQDPGVREIDLGCAPSMSQTCTTTWATFPFAIDSAQTFAFTATDALVVGSQVGTGQTYVFRLSPTAATEVLTKQPHLQARAVWSPVGSIVLFGGGNQLESFSP